MEKFLKFVEKNSSAEIRKIRQKNSSKKFIEKNSKNSLTKIG